MIIFLRTDRICAEKVPTRIKHTTAYLQVVRQGIQRFDVCQLSIVTFFHKFICPTKKQFSQDVAVLVSRS